MGITAEDVAQETEILVWGENWDAVILFSRLHTQWRHGFGGPTGLDYAALKPTIELLALEVEDTAQLFDDLQTLEGAALKEMARNQKKPGGK